MTQTSEAEMELKNYKTKWNDGVVLEIRKECVIRFFNNLMNKITEDRINCSKCGNRHDAYDIECRGAQK